MPLDPRNRSGPDPNTIPYTRNDSISQTARPNNPSTFDRAESHKDKSHYEGDNARWPYAQSEAQYDNPYKQVEGVLDIGLDDSLWAYSDEDIIKKLRSKIAKKYNVNPMYVKINIDRAKGKIKYNRTQYIQAVTKKEAAQGVAWNRMQDGAYFKIGETAYATILNDKWRSMNPISTVWKKISNETILNVETGEQSPVKFMVEDLMIPVKAPAVPKRKKGTRAKATTFEKLPVGALFVFVDMPQSLQFKNVPGKERVRYFEYDQKFKKINENQCQAEDRVVQMEKHKNEEVIPDTEWVKKFQYKKEPIESAFNRMFGEYKTYNTKWGEAVKLLWKDFERIMIENNVSEAKLNSLSKEDKSTGIWSGTYVGEDSDFMWTRIKDSDEVEVTRS